MMIRFFDITSTFVNSMVLISTLLVNVCALAKENDPLVPRKKFLPQEYYEQPAADLNQALQKLQEKKQTEGLRIDLQEALKEDQSEKSKLVKTNKEQALSFSILDIRARALKNNLSIEVAKVDPLIAEAGLRQEQAKFDNIIFAYARQTNRDLPRIADDNVAFSSLDPTLNSKEIKLNTLEQTTRITDIAAGVRVPLRTGGTLTLSSPLENKRINGALDSKQYRSALRFSVSQPLLRNATKQVNEASIRIAELDAQSVNLRTKLQAIRIIAASDKAYWGIYEGWAQLDVRKQQYELALQNLTMVSKRVKEGFTAAIEMNRAEIGVADRMEALIVAETNLKLAQRQLRFFMNEMEAEQSAENMISPETEPQLMRYEFNREKLLKDAMAGRLELLDLELRLAADAVNIAFMENQTLPLFSLDYQYGALSNTAGNFGNGYDNMLNGRFNDWSIGLTFEMPFTNEANLARLENAVQQRNKRLANKKLQTLSVRKEILDALDQIDNHWQRILAARQQVVIAGLNYDAELKQFNEGLRTMTEVLETMTHLGEAQIKEVRAVTDYHIAMVDLAYATGTLIGYSGVDFK